MRFGEAGKGTAALFRPFASRASALFPMGLLHKTGEQSQHVG
jgi:hypothetical protein